MKVEFEIKQLFMVEASVLYHAWLNGEEHSKMTGGEAECSDKVGGQFTAWDGYISGTNKSLNPDKEIVQSWRTTEFGDHDQDSELIIRLQELSGGTELTLIHKNIPEEQPDYEQGWIDNYFSPMANYFEKYFDRK